MKKISIHIFVLLWFTIISVSAQETISADITKGCDSLIVQFTLDNARSLNEYTSVVWHFGDESSAQGSLSVTHTYTSPGIYNVRCVLDGGRIIDRPGLISVSITPFADFTFKDISVTDSEFRYYFENQYFKPIEGVMLNYTWRFPDGTELHDSVAEYVFAEMGINEVFLLLMDENGCSDSIVKKVPVSKQLMVPNVFSPNSDEINDYFEVTTSGDFTYLFKVFSQAGLQVYSSNSPLISWDGRTIGGREAPEGVYFYTIECDETPVETSLAGFVHLFR